MQKIKTLKQLWKHNKRGILSACFGKLTNTGILNKLSDEVYLRMAFKINMGTRLNLQAPSTFNEKLQWLKLNDRKPEYTLLVDKYEVRKIVARLLGEQYLIPLIGVWDNPDDIDFKSLPERFVLKCTHDSGSICICKDKSTFDFETEKKKLGRKLKKNLFYWGREWPYLNVKPRIIAEKYMEDNACLGELIDYKLMCFNGKVKCTFTCTDRFSSNGLHVTFYDEDWNKLPFERHYPADAEPCEKPLSYNKMVELAERLSQNIPFARIDFYEISGNPYFGEITLYPGNGMEEFTPAVWDNILGSWIELPYERARKKV